VARLSGTSVAAPEVARVLLGYFLATSADGQSDADERMALTGQANWGQPDPRMGQGALRA
jgi:hypothetical protein